MSPNLGTDLILLLDFGLQLLFMKIDHSWSLRLKVFQSVSFKYLISSSVIVPISQMTPGSIPHLGCTLHESLGRF